MANCGFGWPIWSDLNVGVPTFAPGWGSWQAALPLTNLQDRRLAKVARSTDATAASTQFMLQLYGGGGAVKPIYMVAIPKHNLSATGWVRVRGNNAAGASSTIWFYPDFGTGWTSVGTPTRVAANHLCADGVPLDQIGDDTAAALEGYTQVQPNFGTTGLSKAISCRISKGTSTSSVIRLRDTTAGADRLLAAVTWTGSVATVTMTTGTLSAQYDLGAGDYRLFFLTTAVTTANTHQLEIYPATTAALAIANTGDVFIGDFEISQYNDDRIYWDTGCVTPWPAGLLASDLAGLNVPFVFVPTRVWAQPLGTAVSCVYVNINDTANSAGYVELGRFIASGLYQPAVNLSYGAGIGLSTETTRTITDGGAALYNSKAVRRTVTGVLDNIAEAEALGTFWKMQKQLGTSGQLMFMWDTAETTYRHERSFLGVLQALSPLTQPYVSRYQGAFSVVEEL